MKRLIALVLAGLMVFGGACLAAQWPEGRSAAQPYSHLPEVNLSETMGYILLFPRAKLPVTRFCDVLGMYLPREDIELGEGMAHVYEKVEGEDKPVEVCAIDFSDPASVEIRDMSEGELTDLIWGGGTCVEMHLPKSLAFGDADHQYYVLMDEGCYTAADGALKSISITSEDAWIPVISGDYGVSGLYYLDAELPVDEGEIVEDDEEIEVIEGITDVVIETPEDEEGEDAEEDAEAEDAEDEEPEATETPEPTDTPEPEAAEDEAEVDPDAPIDPSQYVTHPDPGDKVRFDLVIGGDAVMAVLYSDNGSVEFDEIEFSESGPVEGTVIGEDVQWGVAFYDANDYIFDTIDVVGR